MKTLTLSIAALSVAAFATVGAFAGPANQSTCASVCAAKACPPGASTVRHIPAAGSKARGAVTAVTVNETKTCTPRSAATCGTPRTCCPRA